MGRVRVYEWDPLGDTWLILALGTWSGNVNGDIDGETNDRFGTSVALSKDGQRFDRRRQEQGPRVPLDGTYDTHGLVG